MTRPHIEYLIREFSFGMWSQVCVLAPVGTSFTKVFDNYSWTEIQITDGLRWPSYAWPGGYEIHYLVKDCGVLCHHCANKELPRTLDKDDDQFFIVASDINYEDSHLFCDHCNRQIEPAYGDDDEAA